MSRILQVVALVYFGCMLGLLPVAADEVEVKDEPAAKPPLARTFNFPTFAGRQVWDTWSNRSGSPLTLTPIDATIRGHLKIPKDQGLLVSQVSPQSPAWAAGLRDQDILLTLGTIPLANLGALTKALKEAGEKPLPLTLLRGGEKTTIQVQPMIEIGLGPIPSENLTYVIGLVTSPVDPLLRSQLKLPRDQGLAVRDIDVTGPANKVKLAVGDILLELNGKSLNSEQTLFNLVQAEGEKPIELFLIHEGSKKSIVLTPVPRKDVTGQKIGVMFAGRTFPNVDSTTLHFNAMAPIGRVNRSRDDDDAIGGNPRNTIHGNPRNTIQAPLGQVIRVVPSPEQLDKVRIAEEMKLGVVLKDKKAASPDPVAKRLDEMSTQMDALRKAVDELAKVLKEKK